MHTSRESKSPLTNSAAPSTDKSVTLFKDFPEQILRFTLFGKLDTYTAKELSNHPQFASLPEYKMLANIKTYNLKAFYALKLLGELANKHSYSSQYVASINGDSTQHDNPRPFLKITFIYKRITSTFPLENEKNILQEFLISQDVGFEEEKGVHDFETEWDKTNVKRTFLYSITNPTSLITFPEKIFEFLQGHFDEIKIKQAFIDVCLSYLFCEKHINFEDYTAWQKLKSPTDDAINVKLQNISCLLQEKKNEDCKIFYDLLTYLERFSYKIELREKIEIPENVENSSYMSSIYRA